MRSRCEAASLVSSRQIPATTCKKTELHLQAKAGFTFCSILCFFASQTSKTTSLISTYSGNVKGLVRAMRAGWAGFPSSRKKCHTPHQVVREFSHAKSLLKRWNVRLANPLSHPGRANSEKWLSLKGQMCPFRCGFSLMERITKNPQKISKGFKKLLTELDGTL